MNKDFGEALYWRGFVLSILLSNGNSTATFAQQTPASKALPLPWSPSLYLNSCAQVHVLRHVPLKERFSPTRRQTSSVSSKSLCTDRKRPRTGTSMTPKAIHYLLLLQALAGSIA
jgi:hypothetical protein